MAPSAALSLVLLSGCANKGAEQRIHLATQAEVDAVLPRELVVEPPVDAAARKRSRDFHAELDRLGGAKMQSFGIPLGLLLASSPGKPSSKVKVQALVPAMAFYKAHAATIARISKILSAGSMQPDPTVRETTEGVRRELEVTELIRLVLICAEAEFDRGDYESGKAFILLGINIGDRYLEASDGVWGYLLAVLIRGIGSAGTERVARNPKVPLDTLRQILGALHASTVVDEPLIRSMRLDFQRITRRELAVNPIGLYRSLDKAEQSLRSNPNKLADFDASSNPPSGTLDAVETARKCGERVMEELANLRRPFSESDFSSEDAARQSVDQILTVHNDASPSDPILPNPEAARTPLTKDEFNSRMNSGHNTMGRAICYGFLTDQVTMRNSLQGRVNVNATRVLLASAIYRRTHGGALPPTIDGFLPILGKWPVDAFNGKPMIYRAKQEKVYSVGEDLKDDGGSFTWDGTRVRDVGLSLSLTGR